MIPLLSLCLFAAVQAELPSAQSARPNVVIILADDMGYGDVHALNPQSRIPTPNLDRLAEEGMRFTDAHSPSAVCTPTRYGLITGRYCWRSRLTSGVLGGYSHHLIDPDRTTIADVFLNAGYRTASIGNGPLTLGFEHFFGVTASLDMPPYAWVVDDGFQSAATDKRAGSGFPAYMRAGPIAKDFDPQTALDTITAHASDWIQQQAKAQQAFFLYLLLTAPHKPVLPAERFIGQSKLGLYGDFVMQTDDAVGVILKALDKAGVAEDTIVMFSSDNGSFMYRLDADESPVKTNKPKGELQAHERDHENDSSIQGYLSATHRANHLFRGTKADIWEGGHHVPLLVRWPGKTKPQSSHDAPVSLTDFMATAAEIVGATLADDSAEDSFSLLPSLLGKETIKARAAVVHHSANGTFAIRQGK